MTNEQAKSKQLDPKIVDLLSRSRFGGIATSELVKSEKQAGMTVSQYRTNAGVVTVYDISGK